MNKRLSRMIGIALASVLALVMIVSAVPAQAGDLTFSAVTIPAAGADSNLILAGASNVKVAPNGDIFAVNAAGTDVIKSTDGGKNWVAGATFAPAIAGGITAVAISPSYATDKTIVVTSPTLLYLSNDGGANFNHLQRGRADCGWFRCGRGCRQPLYLGHGRLRLDGLSGPGGHGYHCRCLFSQFPH
jgi:hypothetical protein